MRVKCLLLDLDDTVYPAGNGIWESISHRIETYMTERVGIPSAQVAGLRSAMHQRYGTTLRGLHQEYQVDQHDYLAFVHDIPLSDKLEHNPELREMLSGLPLPKWIFTNADRGHAQRVLAALSLEDLFAGIIDIQALWPACKPMPEAFETALSVIGFDAEDVLFVDDSLPNLLTARRRGLQILQVTNQPAAAGDIPSIPSLILLREWLSAAELLPQGN